MIIIWVFFSTFRTSRFSSHIEAWTKWPFFRQSFSLHVLEWEFLCHSPHWSFFTCIKLEIIGPHWFGQWLGTKQAASHYLNQCCSISVTPKNEIRFPHIRLHIALYIISIVLNNFLAWPGDIIYNCHRDLSVRDCGPENPRFEHGHCGQNTLVFVHYLPRP